MNEHTDLSVKRNLAKARKLHDAKSIKVVGRKLRDRVESLLVRVEDLTGDVERERMSEPPCADNKEYWAQLRRLERALEKCADTLTEWQASL